MLPPTPRDNFDPDIAESVARQKLQSDVSIEPPKVVHIQFSQELSDYIDTGADPTGRYSKPASLKEKVSIAFIYALMIAMFFIGLLGGGVGHRLFEALVRLIEGR